MAELNSSWQLRLLTQILLILSVFFLLSQLQLLAVTFRVPFACFFFLNKNRAVLFSLQSVGSSCGALVGFLCGVLVGLIIGDGVGGSFGFIEGVEVGSEDCSSLGNEEGVAVGSEDGSSLGNEEGVLVGDEVGSLLGDKEGAGEVCPIGAVVIPSER